MPARPRVVRGRIPNASSEPPSNAAFTSHTTHRSAMNPPIVATPRRRYCPTAPWAVLPRRDSFVGVRVDWIMTVVVFLKLEDASLVDSSLVEHTIATGIHV